MYKNAGNAENEIAGAELTELHITPFGDAVNGWIYTFNGVNFTTSASTVMRVSGNATIILQADTDNRIKDDDSSTDDTCGIINTMNLTISGGGTLNTTAGAATGKKKGSYGIYGGAHHNKRWNCDGQWWDQHRRIYCHRR